MIKRTSFPRGRDVAGVVAIALATLVLRPVGASPQLAAEASGGTPLPSARVLPAAVAQVNFTALARDEAKAVAEGRLPSAVPVVRERPRYQEPAVPPALRALQPGVRDELPPPSAPSPTPALTFLGAADSNSVIPPDTNGAVGPTHVITTLNNVYRITDRLGAQISSVTIGSFWAPTGATGVFDPKTVYDPYNGRFIATAMSNAASTNSSILIGISATNNPAGGWSLFRYLACAVACGAGAEWWADYPEIGFNANWVAVSANMFTNVGSTFQQSRILILNYPSLRTGVPVAGTLVSTSDFTVVPAVTYSSTEPTLYAVTHLSSGGATYRLNTITGTPAAPVYTQNAVRAHTLLSGWAAANGFGVGNPAPQAPESGTGLVQGVDAGDSRIMNAVFRNGAIWYAQAVALPAVGPTHTAAQWVKLSTAGNDLDAGRVNDATATSTNGGKWYAYPTISVNQNGDALVGFTQFASNQYPSAAYAFRAVSDASGTLRDVVTFRTGADFYFKTFSGTRNRWGDYSATQVDPVDDRSFWTVQEASSTRVGNGNGSGRWSVWWARVAVTTLLTRTPGDFDGDGRSDVTVFRPSNGTWYTAFSANLTTSGISWGNASDVVTPGDYDGDGRTDRAVFRPSDGTWYLDRSTAGPIGVPWGNSADRPVQADYDGDGRTDVAVFRPSTGTWYIVQSTAGAVAVAWGNSADVAVPADYDGDGKADVAVYRPSNGTWYIVNSGGGSTGVPWGNSADIAVPGDYDGDGRANVAVFRPSTGTWYILQPSGGFTSVPWGNSLDVPVPGDYDGDRRTDVAVFRPSNGTWFVINSSTGSTQGTSWGNAADVPILRRP